MKCPYCGDEMIRGYLMSSRDIRIRSTGIDRAERGILLERKFKKG